jgi:hypothetical protein
MLSSITSPNYPTNFNQIINMQSSSVHKISSSIPPHSKIPYEGPSRHEILFLISRWNAAHHSVDHIITQAPTELDMAIIESLKTLDRERIMKDKAVDRDLEFLVRDIEMIRKVTTESDWDKVNWERIDEGIDTLKQVRTLKGKGFRYVAPTQRLRDEVMRGGGEVLVTQSEDQSFREVVNKAKGKLSCSANRAREKERQRNLRESDSEVESVREEILRTFTQQIKDLQKREMIDKGGNQEEIAKVKLLVSEMRPNRRVEYGAESSEAKDRVLQRRSFDGNQLRKDVPREAVRAGPAGSRARPDTPGKVQKPMPNAPNLQKATFYQAPLLQQTPKDHCPSKALGHQLPVPETQVQSNMSSGHQRPVSIIRAPSKGPDHQKQVSPNTHSSLGLHKRCSYQQLRTPAPRTLHKAVSHQQLPTTTSRAEPKGPADQQNPQNQHRAHHAPIPKKVTFDEQLVKLISHVNQARSKSPNGRSPVSHQNRPKSNILVQKRKITSYKQPTEPIDEKDPTKDPANNVMFNKRPRVATDIKEMRLKNAHDDARALASEIRKMG